MNNFKPGDNYRIRIYRFFIAEGGLEPSTLRVYLSYLPQ